MLKITELVEQLRVKAQSNGCYAEVSEASGVGFHWLSKFASGNISNPTVNNLQRLEKFFFSGEKAA